MPALLSSVSIFCLIPLIFFRSSFLVDGPIVSINPVLKNFFAISILSSSLWIGFSLKTLIKIVSSGVIRASCSRNSTCILLSPSTLSRSSRPESRILVFPLTSVFIFLSLVFHSLSAFSLRSRSGSTGGGGGGGGGGCRGGGWLLY